jgi:hypothetical protein
MVIFRSRGFANLCDVTPSVLIDYLHDYIDGPFALLLDVMKRDAPSRATHSKLRQAPECISGAVGMDGRKRPAMACVQGIEEDTRFSATDLAHDDPVRPMPKSCLQQVGEADLAIVRIELSLGGDDVRLPYMEFGYIFQDQDAITVRDKTGEHISECGLS